LADVEDDGISFEEKMEKLSSELRDAFEKGRDLEKEIEKNLKELGF
jgi:type I restriction enzyme M protein